jgi:hypothetical protein
LCKESKEDRNLKCVDSKDSRTGDSPLTNKSQFGRAKSRSYHRRRKPSELQNKPIHEGVGPEQGDQPIRRVLTSEEESKRIFAGDKKAFEQMLPRLLEDTRYRGKYVAVVDGELADSDSDEAAMVMRVYRKYGYRPIYEGKVAEEKEYVEFPSPE